jgi:hypothetical protein
MMNDESEYLFAKSKFVEAYQNRKVWIAEVPRYMANTQRNAHEKHIVMMIGCLTEACDDVGLWEWYSHSGRDAL